MTDPTPLSSDSLSSRITAYLAGGGLFNPELANHDAVRDLIIDCRDEIARLQLDGPPVQIGKAYCAQCGSFKLVPYHV